MANTIIYLVTITGETLRNEITKAYDTFEAAKNAIAEDTAWAFGTDRYEVHNIPSYTDMGKFGTTFIIKKEATGTPATVYMTYVIKPVEVEH